MEPSNPNQTGRQIRRSVAEMKGPPRTNGRLGEGGGGSQQSAGRRRHLDWTKSLPRKQFTNSSTPASPETPHSPSPPPRVDTLSPGRGCYVINQHSPTRALMFFPRPSLGHSGSIPVPSLGHIRSPQHNSITTPPSLPHQKDTPFCLCEI